MAQKKPRPGSADQIQLFKKTARELDCSESAAHFDVQLENIGRAKIEPAPKKRPRRPLKIALPDA